MKTKTPPKMTNKDSTEEVRMISGTVEVFRAEPEGDEAQSMPTLRGYAAKFNTLSEFMWGVRERFLPGAFDGRLEDDVRALFDHEGVPMARTKSGTLSLQIDETGLAYEFTPPDTEAARSLVAAIERGDIDGASIRFGLSRDGYDYVSDEKDGEIREIKRVDRLRDISIVTFPAYPDASAELQRSLDEFKRSLEPEDLSGPLEALSKATEALAES